VRSVQDVDSLADIDNYRGFVFSQKHLFGMLDRYDFAINAQFEGSKRAGMEGCFQIFCFHELNIKFRRKGPSYFGSGVRSSSGNATRICRRPTRRVGRE
jgi:hypothetical protein